MANTPKIRFKNFSDEWVESRLGELGETYSGLSGKTKNDFGRGNARYITYLNVFSNSIADIKLTEPIEKDEKQNQVKFGDVLFTTSSETPNEVGMSSVWLGNFQNCYLNSFCFGYRLTQKINHYYLAYLLRSENIRNKIILLAQGISRYNISKNKMMDISISIPNLTEQEKIGAFFSKLDKLISLHQSKFEKLQKIKKSCLQNLFPQNNQNTPKIRFKNFSDEWVENKLGDTIISIPFKAYLANAEKIGNYPVIQQGDIPIAGYSNQEPFLDFCNVVLFGDHTLSLYNPKSPFLLASDGIKILSAKNLYDDFLFQLLKKYMPKSEGYKRHFSILKNICFYYPNSEEQEKIGAFFSKLDKLIALHQSKFEKLQKIKKSCLQNMFV
ncbi:MAG: restriction endonuclease subunit S [Campylobacter sp.]|uniref:restriction endonuclease subunit S n=1 Tax=Campylobacter sp. TaxID=205 RepID=UPI001B501434|nr:restriction endonuclease subunit S [Campylobacter sp.]MBP3674994.1 restriction endonuclease subunit S [Campylobacter sp.]